jgi:hypothetical protein
MEKEYILQIGQTNYAEPDSDNNEINSEQNQEEEEEEEEGENETQEDRCVHRKNTDVKVHRIVGCPKCLWRDMFNVFPLILNHLTTCSICQHQFPINKNALKSV